jgi:hypothetical protein
MAYETYDVGDGVEMRIDAYRNGVVVANTLYTLTIIEPERDSLAERTSVITQTQTAVTVSGVTTTTTGQTNFVADTATGEYVYTFAVKRSRKHKWHYQISGPLAAEPAYFNVRLSDFIDET